MPPPLDGIGLYHWNVGLFVSRARKIPAFKALWISTVCCSLTAPSRSPVVTRIRIGEPIPNAKLCPSFRRGKSSRWGCIFAFAHCWIIVLHTVSAAVGPSVHQNATNSALFVLLRH